MVLNVTEALYILAYLAIFLLLVGGAVYLFLTRRRGELRGVPVSLSPETLEKAGKLSGTYRLSDLERILTELGTIGAWGVVVELGLTRIGDIAQIILDPKQAQFYSHTTGSTPDYLEKYRRSVEGAGLLLQNIENVEDVFYVKIVGSWSQIADVLRRVVREIYGVEDHEEIELVVFV